MSVERLPAERVSLSVEYRAVHDGHSWLAGVVVLIEGRDLCSSSGNRGEFIGVAPAELTAQAALVEPSEHAGEVHLCRCSCGELGCGAVIARSTRRADKVVWDLFQGGARRRVDLDAPLPAPDAVIFQAETYERFVAHLRDLERRYPGF